MSQIPPIDQVLRSLRVQPLLEKAATPESHRASRQDTKARKPNEGASEAADYVVRQIGAIAGNDPERRRRAFRIFLEGRLIELMGRDALHLPAVGKLLDQVHDAMSANAEMARAMDSVADRLLTSGTDDRARGKLMEAFGRDLGAS